MFIALHLTIFITIFNYSMTSIRKAKNKNPSCLSMNIILCGEVLNKVHGRMGRHKLETGYNMSKLNAAISLILENSAVFNDQEIKEGSEMRIGWKRK